MPDQSDQPRVCALDECHTELTGRQVRFCSREHSRVAERAPARTCGLGGCDAVLTRRQGHFCSRAHVHAAYKLAEPDTRPCQLPGCDVTIVRDHARVGQRQWDRRKFCTVEHRNAGQARVRPVRAAAPLTGPVVPCAVRTRADPPVAKPAARRPSLGLRPASRLAALPCSGPRVPVASHRTAVLPSGS